VAGVTGVVSLAVGFLLPAGWGGVVVWRLLKGTDH
jgi:fructose-specific phosphotransferase system IIC component